MHGEISLAPVEPHCRNLPASMIGILAPLLDKQAEAIAWEPVSYLCPPQYLTLLETVPDRRYR